METEKITKEPKDIFKDTLTIQELMKILNVDKQLLTKAIEFELIKTPIEMEI